MAKMQVISEEERVVSNIKASLPGNNAPVDVSSPDLKIEDKNSEESFFNDLKGLKSGETPEIWKQVGLLKKRLDKIENLPILRWFLK